MCICILLCARASLYLFLYLWVKFGAGSRPPHKPGRRHPDHSVQDLHAQVSSNTRLDTTTTITQRRNAVDFSCPSGVGPVKPCAQQIPQVIQQRMCWVIHLYVRLARGPCSSEAVQSPVLPWSPCTLQKGLHMTNQPMVRFFFTIARMRHVFRCSVYISM